MAFWVSWPLLFFYLRWSRRTRVLIVCGEKIAVTKGWLGTGQWSLPGGGIHKNEDAVTGAVREVFEETALNLRPEQIQFVKSDFMSKYGLSFAYDMFFVELNQELPLKPQRLEIIEARWINASALNENNAEEPTLKAVNLWKKRL